MQKNVNEDIEALMKYRLGRSKEDIEAAKLLIKNNSLYGANNRVYYAVFHAILAVQSNDNINSKRHGQIIGEFNRNYIKTNIFPKDLGRQIDKIQSIRHSSDYDDFYIPDKQETKQNIKIAEEIVKVAEKYLTDEFNIKIEDDQR